jgi:hypothetical protein
VLFETADLNADVRDTATDYRDPAIAVPQDKVAGGWAARCVFGKVQYVVTVKFQKPKHVHVYRGCMNSCIAEVHQ